MLAWSTRRQSISNHLHKDALCPKNLQCHDGPHDVAAACQSGGNVHGGVIMKFIDDAAGVVATKHARTNVVTAAIERLDFHRPVFIGNLLILKACSECYWQKFDGDRRTGRGRRPPCRRNKTYRFSLPHLRLPGPRRSSAPVPPFTPTTEDGIRRAQEAANRKQCFLQN